MERYYGTIQSRIDSIPFGFYEGVRQVINLENIPAEKKKFISIMDDLRESYEGYAAII